jgi:hypothetical protein
MLNVGVKSTKNNHPSCQSLLGSSASMITEQLRMGTIVLELVSWLYFEFSIMLANVI